VALVARAGGLELSDAGTGPFADVGQEREIARQRPARECLTGAQIRFGPDPDVALEPGLDFPRVGADAFAHAGDLVHERDRRCQERVEGVLGHLRRLDAHPLDLGNERREHATDALARHGLAHPRDHPVGRAKVRDCRAQPQVLRDRRKRQPIAFARGFRNALETRDGPDRKLRGHRDRGAAVQHVDERRDAVDDEIDVGPVGCVDRRVVRDPDQLAVLQCRRVRTQAQPPRHAFGTDQFG
jgi:hypothetical protein